jgi:hypothetical protein
VRGALNWRSERPLPTWLLFGIVLLVFAILIAGSLPDVLSLDLWVFKDRGSLLNMDRLIDQGLRPGIDAYYSYGLLPLLIQRVLFRLFGRDFWPILACNLIYFLLIAAGWTLVIRALSRHRLWMLVLAALSPLVISVNPTLPYSLVMLSMLWALVLVLYGRGSWALAVAAVGCVSVPSVPLVLAALLVVMIVIEWWLDGSRRIGGLVWRLLPGAVTYGLLVSVLVAAFGIGPMLATATPLTGMEFYKSVHYSLFGSAMAFLHPPGTGVGYYLQSPVVWFVVGELMVWGLGVAAITLMIRGRAVCGTGSLLRVRGVRFGVPARLLRSADRGRGGHWPGEPAGGAAARAAADTVRGVRPVRPYPAVALDGIDLALSAPGFGPRPPVRPPRLERGMAPNSGPRRPASPAAAVLRHRRAAIFPPGPLTRSVVSPGWPAIASRSRAADAPDRGIGCAGRRPDRPHRFHRPRSRHPVRSLHNVPIPDPLLFPRMDASALP